MLSRAAVKIKRHHIRLSGGGVQSSPCRTMGPVNLI
jgi:hypothetical protein